MASLIERTKYCHPFDGFPTLFDSCTLNDVFECGNVQLVYFSSMRDEHHEQDRARVQQELTALSLSDMFVLCIWDHRTTVEVYGIRRFLDLKKAVTCCIFHYGKRDPDVARLKHISELINDKMLFPSVKDLGTVLEERKDFEERIRDVVAFSGVVVGHVYYDTADGPLESDRDKITVKLAGMMNETAEYAYFTRFEDHGVHGSVFYFILKKVS